MSKTNHSRYHHPPLSHRIRTTEMRSKIGGTNVPAISYREYFPVCGSNAPAISYRLYFLGKVRSEPRTKKRFELRPLRDTCHCNGPDLAMIYR
eukprot:g77029.t1